MINKAARACTTGALSALLVASTFSVLPASAAHEHDQTRVIQLRVIREIRAVYTSEFGLPRPAGLTYSPKDRALLVAGSASGHPDITLVGLSPTGHETRREILPDLPDPANLAFDAESVQLTALARSELVHVSKAGASHRADLARYGINGGRSMTYDPAGRLYILDANAGSVVRITPGASGLQSGTVSRLSLQSLGTRTLRGIAFNAADGLLYVADPANSALYSVDSSSNLVGRYQMPGLEHLRAMVFAPTADPTDAPERTSLYVADAGAGPRDLGRVAEFSLAPPAVAAAPTTSATLVRSTATSQWNPPAPDTSGVAYLPAADRLVVVDSEVDEMTIFRNVNLWMSSRTGSVTDTGVTTRFSNEPTGVAYNPANGHLFVTDDDPNIVSEVASGGDGRYGTADDVVTSLSTNPMGNTDPEDVTVDTSTGSLYLVAGVGAEVYRYSPGPNGRFDALPPTGDDSTSHFDVGAFGAQDPEGIAYDAARDTLFVLDHGTQKVYEVTKAGALIQTIDVTAAGQRYPAGIALAPATNGSGQTDMFLVDRGVDNNSNPNENDGKLTELSANLGPIGNQPPTVNAGPDQSVVQPNAVTLSGSVSDDGLPNPPGTTTSQWSVVSGTGTVTFADPAAPSTMATISDPGTYVLRLTASDSELSSSDDVTVAVVGPNGPFTLDVSVAAGSDDAEEAATGSVNLSSSDLELVNDGNDQTVGIRFTGVSVPPGSTIDSAYVQFTTDEVTTGATSLTIQGQASGNASTFTTATRSVSSRPRTGASFSWVPTAWNTVGETGPNQRTQDLSRDPPDLSPVVQEIVNRADWVSGNALAVIVTGTGRRTARAFELGPAPVLHVVYRTGPVTNRAPTVNAGPDQSLVLPNAATLSGSVSDDGLPHPPGTTTSQWSMVSGPGTVTFADPASPSTTATFSDAGSYVLRLTASDSELTASDDLLVIASNPPPPGDNAPSAALTVTPSSGAVPLDVTADASASTDTDATPIATYNFDFGDGTTTGAQASGTAIHTYTAAGSYTVTVTVTDTAGLSSTASHLVSVNSANLVGNPGFETDLTGWNNNNASETLTRVAGGHSGSWAAKLTNVGTKNTSCVLNDSPNWIPTPTTQPGTYTGTMWVRADSAGASFKLRFREYQGSTQVGTQATTVKLTTSWKQVTVTYTPAAPGASTLDFNALVSSAQPGTCFYADDASITVR
jgi:PKD repeat protein